MRINPLKSGAALDDLAAVLPGKPHGILLPKCLPEDVRTLDHYLTAFEAAFGLTPAAVRIIAIATETPAAIFALGRYAGVSSRLEGITWGAEDLAACLGGNNRRLDGVYDDVYRLARSLCLLAAAAAGADRSLRLGLHEVSASSTATRSRANGAQPSRLRERPWSRWRSHRSRSCSPGTRPVSRRSRGRSRSPRRRGVVYSERNTMSTPYRR